MSGPPPEGTRDIGDGRRARPGWGEVDGPRCEASRAPGSHTCYNLGVTSLRARLHIEGQARRPGARTRIPPVFVLAVFMIAIIGGGLLLGSVLAAGRGLPATPGLPVGGGTPSPLASSSDTAPSPTPSAAPATSTADPVPTPRYAGYAPASLLTGYVWPLVNARVTLPFGPTSWGEFLVNGQLFHDGVDMSTTCGDKVHAAHDGVVLAAGRRYDEYIGWVGDVAPYYHLLDTKGWWNSLPIVIIIDDGDGYRSIYAHESAVTVKPGQHVIAGQVIGYEGATGNASGCHVHFGLFSPMETDEFQLEPSIAKRLLLPAYEIARINPLLVLPFRCEIEEMRALRPAEAAACPALPTPVPAAKPKPTAQPTVLPASPPTAPPSEVTTASPPI